MREEVSQRHAVGHVRVGQPQLGHELPHGIVEVEQALLLEPQSSGRGNRLRDRPGLEERVEGDRERVVDARDTPGDGLDRAAGEHAEGDAWDLELVHRRLESGGDLSPQTG